MHPPAGMKQRGSKSMAPEGKTKEEKERWCLSGSRPLAVCSVRCLPPRLMLSG